MFWLPLAITWSTRALAAVFSVVSFASIPSAGVAAIDVVVSSAIGGRKVLLLMTDGINANSARLWDGAMLPNGNVSITADWRDGSKTNALTSQICTNIKADGIEIYTVLFDVKDPTIETILKNCAGTVPPDTERQYSFVANDREGLLKAFRDITDQLRALKLAK